MDDNSSSGRKKTTTMRHTMIPPVFRSIITTIFRLTFQLFRKLILITLDYDLNKLLKKSKNKSTSRQQEFDYDKKRKQIEECLNSNNSSSSNSNNAAVEGGGGATDLWKLRELALSKGGLLEAKYRKQAWLKLVGLDDDEEMAFAISSSPSSATASITALNDEMGYDDNISSPRLSIENSFEEEKKSESSGSCPDGDLIRRDVGRSVLFRYSNATTTTSPKTVPSSAKDNSEQEVVAMPSHNNEIPTFASERLALVLEDTIKRSANNASKLHYYQGLHDVAGVILHNMEYNTNATISILSKLCQSHFRDAMRENFGNVTWLLSLLMLPLVEKVDGTVHEVLQIAEIDLSNICLPWVITWFTHDMYNADTAGRLVDMFISSHPLLPIYFAVAVITHPLLKQVILTADLNDPAFLFSMIKKMPLSIVSDVDGEVQSSLSQQDLQQHPESIAEVKVTVQELLEDSISIMKRIPPRDLLLLVDKKDLYSREDLLQRASSISMFKAVPSWSIEGGQLSTIAKATSSTTTPTTTTTIMSQTMPSFLSDNDDTTSATNTMIRAKLASGIPILQDTVNDSTLTMNRNWGSQRYQNDNKSNNKSNKKKNKIFRKPRIFQKIRRLLFGKRKQQRRTSVP